ncbi:hypothetical protein [Acetobacter persici]|uniref:hypothetical protein n=1 Tax=Acetobacter persici TaxID=1076596 RepID=UPI001BA5A0D0|nr:hypothetical protein [Acetobacter persici]MBS1016957.1 hypothetical protein [Acetobacter persici]
MPIKPIASTPFYLPILTKWNNEPVLQSYNDLDHLTRHASLPLFFAEPVIRWEQKDTAGEIIPGNITWYGPEFYDASSGSFRPLPEWGAQSPQLTAHLAMLLTQLAAAATSNAQKTMLEAALVIPSMHAVLTNGQGQFILCPWGWHADNTQTLPYLQTPLGQITGKIVARPDAAASQSDAPRQASSQAAPLKELPPPPSVGPVILPARHLPRGLTLSLGILTGFLFFLLGFWAGALFLLRWVVGVHLEHPLSPASLTVLWHLCVSVFHASPDAARTLLGGATP